MNSPYLVEVYSKFALSSFPVSIPFRRRIDYLRVTAFLRTQFHLLETQCKLKFTRGNFRNSFSRPFTAVCMAGLCFPRSTLLRRNSRSRSRPRPTDGGNPTLRFNFNVWTVWTQSQSAERDHRDTTELSTLSKQMCYVNLVT